MQKRQYEKLIVWQEAYSLCLWIYRVTKGFPPEERFGLVSQMRRSSYSVHMNIAEGNSRRSKKDKLHFLEMSASSLEELHCQCLMARDLTYCTETDFREVDDHIQRVSYLLMKLRSSLK